MYLLKIKTYYSLDSFSCLRYVICNDKKTYTGSEIQIRLKDSISTILSASSAYLDCRTILNLKKIDWRSWKQIFWWYFFSVLFFFLSCLFHVWLPIIIAFLNFRLQVNVVDIWWCNWYLTAKGSIGKDHAINSNGQYSCNTMGILKFWLSEVPCKTKIVEHWICTIILTWVFFPTCVLWLILFCAARPCCASPPQHRCNVGCAHSTLPSCSKGYWYLSIMVMVISGSFS